MPTVKELKAELKKRGIEYPKKALKDELKELIYLASVSKTVSAEVGFDAKITINHGFTDPNADPVTQA